MAKLGWMEKWTLRFAVVALLFLALSGFEGMLMRSQQYDIDSLHGMETLLNTIRPGEIEPTTAELYYAMLTAHPIVGIYGFVYMAIFGAFYFLVPFLIKKPVKHPKLVIVNFWLQIIGVMVCWAAGFFGLFNAMYTLYWPLPVAFDRVPLLGSIFFMLGAAAIMVNILLFSFNIFKTVLSKDNSGSYTLGQFLRAAFGIPRLMKLFGKEDKNAVNLDYNGMPVFIVAVARGSIDTVINAIVLLTAGVLILVYGLFALFGNPLNPLAVDALLFKNVYWWGLDMVADGNALIYTAGVWYLLVPLLTGRQLFGANVVKTVIMVDLLVSMGVWSHHLLGDTSQPMWMKILSGQLITWGEYFTMGLTIFVSLMTIWKARPVKMSAPLKFVLGSMFGFVMGGIAGLIQANVGLNMIFHNTQWVVALHAHTFLLTGVGTMLFAVIYTLVPMLTKLEFKYKKLVDWHLWLWLIGSVSMSYAMGMAGSKGMLRRTLYTGGEFTPFTLVAIIGGTILSIGFVIFLINLVSTLGLKNVFSLILPEKWLSKNAPVPVKE
ncbi:MAG: cbb3-type cytochrome c oxidase subunit I [Chloroflexi bacterium HGW-Chloroflexi-5]|jgi:cytochrome c oxidase subunit 1|nr:MAG: cbb3-type cytochrome c oxidase subunit I [Chloroflexi bacterium HGW-Chloroflexi-5]